ncbi:MAG: pilus assembly protein PilM [Methylophagaceae bacterium]
MFSLKAKTSDSNSAGIAISANGIALAIVDHKQKIPSLKHAQFYPCSSSEQSAQLTQLSKQHQLNSIPCNFVLNPYEYQILQVDAPEVPKQELSTALRWHIKDLIDFHIDDVVLEHLDLPTQNISGKQHLHVIACRQSLIQNHVDLLHSAHCNINTIDISTLAARNIIKHLNLDNSASIGLLNLWSDTSRISIFVNDDLYINRNSNIGLDTLAFVSSEDNNSESIVDSLALELQRTFDYYESHSRQAAIEQLIIMTNGQTIPDLDQMIKQRLSIDCLTVKLTDFINLENSNEITDNCLMAVGGALRNEH